LVAKHITRTAVAVEREVVPFRVTPDPGATVKACRRPGRYRRMQYSPGCISPGGTVTVIVFPVHLRKPKMWAEVSVKEAVNEEA